MAKTEITKKRIEEEALKQYPKGKTWVLLF